MHHRDVLKPDGRALTLYGVRPVEVTSEIPSPSVDPVDARPVMRWHPLRGEWVMYAAHRMGRTFLPPPEYDPLAPGDDPLHPTELPVGPWEVAVFDNRFPSLHPAAGDAPASIVPTAPAHGHCEVIVFGQDPVLALGAMPLSRIELVLQVWADRCSRLAARPGTAYVLPFENRGAEVGVTLHHPHGQIYAYPVLPPVPARMAAVAAAHVQRHGCGPLAAMIERELADGARLLYRGEAAVAFVPACARYPYEVWVAPIEPVVDFAGLDDAQRADLARALKTVLRKYERLWDRPFPYLMAWYPAPVGAPQPGWHLHAELWPPYRTRDRLKYLAGTELGAGFYAMDALPEEKALELQRVDGSVDRA